MSVAGTAGGAAARPLTERWLRQRLPPAEEVRLGRGNIFILPSACGAGAILLLMLLWLTATNYQNNLVFAVACLLASLFHTIIYHSYANLSGLSMRLVRAMPVFAGESVILHLRLQDMSGRRRGPLAIRLGEHWLTVSGLQAGVACDVELSLPAPRRGWLVPGRLRIESRYPLGFFRVWSLPLLVGPALVYPRPLSAEAEGGAWDQQSDASPMSDAIASGSEDFAGLRRWRRGDSAQRIAWHRVAQERGTWVKQFADPPAIEGWVDWDEFPGLDREHRLSAMCALLLDYGRQGRRCGLRLPGQTIAPDSGEQHRLRCLRALALFELLDETDSS